MQTKSKASRPKQAITSASSRTAEPFISEEEIHNTLSKQYKTKAYKFKQHILAPYNRTYKELAMSASKETDSGNFFCQILIYILIRGHQIYEEGLEKYKGNIEAAEDRVELMLPLEVETNIESFRFEVRKWSRDFSDKDIENMSDMLLEMKKASEDSAITPKKTEGIDTDTAGK